MLDRFLNPIVCYYYSIIQESKRHLSELGSLSGLGSLAKELTKGEAEQQDDFDEEDKTHDGETPINLVHLSSLQDFPSGFLMGGKTKKFSVTIGDDAGGGGGRYMGKPLRPRVTHFGVV